MTPAVAVVVGSGLSGAVADLRAEAEVSFEALPGFRASSVPGCRPGGHGHVFGVPVWRCSWAGAHLYEGHGVGFDDAHPTPRRRVGRRCWSCRTRRAG